MRDKFDISHSMIQLLINWSQREVEDLKDDSIGHMDPWLAYSLGTKDGRAELAKDILEHLGLVNYN